jgi:tRNA pseudouridine38-40 synthase
VIHFTAFWRHLLTDLHRALNAVLAGDVAIVELREAAPGFHARYSARSRKYVYAVYNGARRSPLAARYAYHHAGPLDAAAMDRACACLVGEHDFRPFGWAPREEANRDPAVGRGTMRTVYAARCRRQGMFVYVELEADAFLRRMVRRIVGNLLLVGSGALTVEGFEGLLSLKHRRTPGVAAPAHGLCLLQVSY